MTAALWFLGGCVLGAIGAVGFVFLVIRGGINLFAGRGLTS